MEKVAAKSRRQKRVDNVPMFLMLLPGLIYLIINNYLPMYGITIAFKNLDYSKGIWGSPWVGFKNFEYLFKTKDAFIMIRNTLCYNLVFIFGGLVVALAIAIMMTEIGKMIPAVRDTPSTARRMHTSAGWLRAAPARRRGWGSPR